MAAGGNNKDVQFNETGNLSGSAYLEFDVNIPSLRISGSYREGTATAASGDDYTVVDADTHVYSSVGVNMPNPASYDGRVLTITSMAASITLTPSAGQIDNAASWTMSGSYQTRVFYANAAKNNWFMIYKY